MNDVEHDPVADPLVTVTATGTSVPTVARPMRKVMLARPFDPATPTCVVSVEVNDAVTLEDARHAPRCEYPPAHPRVERPGVVGWNGFLEMAEVPLDFTRAPPTVRTFTVASEFCFGLALLIEAVQANAAGVAFGVAECVALAAGFVADADGDAAGGDDDGAGLVAG